MSTVSFFRLSSNSTESYAMIVSGIGGAIFQVLDDQVLVAKTSGRLSTDLALLLLQGLAGRYSGVDVLKYSRACPPFPDVISFDQLCSFLSLVDLARGTEDLSRITGLTQQRIKQLATQSNTMPTRRVFERLRKFCEDQTTPYKETLSDMVELLASRAKERLRLLYERGE